LSTISRGTTYDNAANLAGAFLDQIIKKYRAGVVASVPRDRRKTLATGRGLARLSRDRGAAWWRLLIGGAARISRGGSRIP
jgi:hypothetical protein